MTSRPFLRGALAAVFCLPLLLPPVAACVQTPAGLRLTGQGAAILDGTFAALCPLEALAGPAALGACPFEEGAFNGAVSAETAPSTPAPAAPAPSSPTVISSPRTSSSTPAIARVFRRGAPGEPPLVHIGNVPAGPGAAVIQARALALPPGPVPVKPAPAPAPVGPGQDAGILDAGADR